MSVAGLLVPLETLLVYLRTSNELSSWKGTGDPEAIVVVMHVQRDGGQYSRAISRPEPGKGRVDHNSYKTKQRPKKCTPKDELGVVPALMTETIDKDTITTPIASAVATAVAVDATQYSCATTNANQTADSTMIFDLSRALVFSETQLSSCHQTIHLVSSFQSAISASRGRGLR